MALRHAIAGHDIHNGKGIGKVTEGGTAVMFHEIDLQGTRALLIQIVALNRYFRTQAREGFGTTGSRRLRLLGEPFCQTPSQRRTTDIRQLGAH